ncbi:type II toxin-antitoxin system RelE/ParE family toxin [Paraburkholderia acidisoli]|uniref:Type II toxin-antitoxin system RelE/ParE family toxin n=1 Tax=Paraburkholderia acidisoli TaxID=2571748 RepID=A0A7Z2JEX2_9BURK|nr:type II toxin-antitoxin system RelE/ParE family toxin [Paraburkholderia acidisoli]QGZ60545.1 type II toxin-antitoxin system RelE/ParE family toxin [Paraburkholderia acidisoli]
MKPLEFRGSSYADLCKFPPDIRKEAGRQLQRVQEGREPNDWKPMNPVGRGAREIRLRDASGAFRVIYVTQIGEVIYVLHCFQKKSERTAFVDLSLAARRYRDVVKELRS